MEVMEGRCGQSLVDSGAGEEGPRGRQAMTQGCCQAEADALQVREQHLCGEFCQGGPATEAE